MSSQKIVPVLTVIFDAEISNAEIPLFRGAVLNILKREGGDINILFHNHDGNNYRFSYPLIQYKRINGKAAIVGIGNGSDILDKYLPSIGGSIQLHGRFVPLKIQNAFPRHTNISIENRLINYSISQWIPLNSKNYLLFNSMENLIDRITLLENSLIGNILSMGKGLDYFFDGSIDCHIKDLNGPYLISGKNVKMMAFDADFCSNVVLPEFIGLGKHVSIGKGVINLVK